MRPDTRASSPAGFEHIDGAPLSPALSSHSSVFDGLSDMSLEDDFELVNDFSEIETHSLASDHDDTPTASYLPEGQRQRMQSSSSDGSENNKVIRESASRLSFSFPDPNDGWADTGSPFASPATKAIEIEKEEALDDGEEVKKEDLDAMCKTVDWVFEGTASATKETEAAVESKPAGEFSIAQYASTRSQREGIDEPPRMIAVKHKSLAAILSTYAGSIKGRGVWSAAALGLALLAAAGASFMSGSSGSAMLNWPFASRPTQAPANHLSGTRTTTPIATLPQPTLSFLSIAATPHARNPKLTSKALIATNSPCQKCALSNIPTSRPGPVMRSDASTSKVLLPAADNRPLLGARSDNRSLMVIPNIDMLRELTAALHALKQWQQTAIQQASLGYEWFAQHYHLALPDLLALQHRMHELWLEMQVLAAKTHNSSKHAEEEARRLVQQSYALTVKHMPTIDQGKLAFNAKSLIKHANEGVVLMKEKVKVHLGEKAKDVIEAADLGNTFDQHKRRSQATVKRFGKTGKAKVKKASRVAKKLKKQRHGFALRGQ